MGLGVSLIAFSPGTLIKSADVNTNFSNLNNANALGGTATWATNVANIVTSPTGQQASFIGISVNSSGVCTFPESTPNDTNGNSYESCSRSSGFGGGTFSHNYIGTPSYIMPMVNSGNNSEGLGIDSLTSTTFHLNMPTGLSWTAMAMNPT